MWALVSQPAGAESPNERVHVTAALEWRRLEGGEDCMGGEAVERAVESRLQRKVFVSSGQSDRRAATATATGADVSVSAEIGPKRGGGWALRVSMAGENGESLGVREVTTEARHCSALDESIPLVLVLMLDISEARVEKARRAGGQRDAAIRIPASTHAPRAPWKFEVAGGAAAALGAMPELGFGPRLALGAAPPSFWRIEAFGTYYVPTEDLGQAGGGRFSLWAAGLAACPIAFTEGRTRIDGCAVQETGIVRSEGFGFARNIQSEQLLWNLGVAARVAYSFAPPVALRVGVGVEAPIVRYRFTYIDSGGREQSLFSVWPVIPSADLMLSIEL